MTGDPRQARIEANPGRWVLDELLPPPTPDPEPEPVEVPGQLSVFDQLTEEDPTP